MSEIFNIKVIGTNTHKKTQVIERFNRTLKLNLGKLFGFSKNFRNI